MPKKLILLLFGALLLAGCGSSASDAAIQDYSGDTNGSVYGSALGEVAAASVEEESVFDGSQQPMATEPAECSVSDSLTNYFTFSRGNSIALAEDGTELLYEYVCDADFTSLDPELDEWVDSIVDEIQKNYLYDSANLIQNAQESLTSGGSFYGYSNYQELGIARHDSKIVSLIVLSSVYSGGAQPNTVQTAWNLDMEKRQVLRLEDVIKPEGGHALAEQVRQQVEDKFLPMGEGTLFDDYTDTIAGCFAEAMTPYWYLNERGLVIFFNQYELGPYAAGIIKTEIPYESLDGILREAYFPGNYSQIPGDLLLRSDWDGYRKIPITVESDGERILVGVEGEVYQVQLSEISWLGETAIGQKMLFSANSLNQRDVLELIGGYDDESRSFAIEFTDGQGNAAIYYIHPDGLSTVP